MVLQTRAVPWADGCLFPETKWATCWGQSIQNDTLFTKHTIFIEETRFHRDTEVPVEVFYRLIHMTTDPLIALDAGLETANRRGPQLNVH